jgi:hypothetical protein
MHNKFCVIDEQTVINGSYNWTNKAEYNYESITIIHDKELAFQFVDEFRAIKVRYFGSNPEEMVVDYTKICVRLETLKNVIVLEDEVDIVYQTEKLEKAIRAAQDDAVAVVIEHIIGETKQKKYGTAVGLINDFVSRFRAVTVFVDTEIAAMRLEIKVLGLQVSSLEDEKAEIEKLLYEFNIRHDKELGELIVKILKLRKEKLNEEAKHDKSKEQEAKEAEQDYQQYKQNYQENAQKVITAISEEEKKELKDKYRSATKLCHPDVVNECYKEQAE